MRLFLGDFATQRRPRSSAFTPLPTPTAVHEIGRLGQGDDAATAPFAQPDQKSTLVVTVEDFADGGVFEHRVDRVGDDAGNRKHFDFVRLLLGRKWKRVGHDDL